MPRTNKTETMDWSSGSEDTDSLVDDSDEEYTLVDSPESSDVDDEEHPGRSQLDFDPTELDSLEPPTGQDVANIEAQIEKFAINHAAEVDEEASEEEELFGGNRVRPEVYRQSMKQLNVDDFKRKHYASGTLKLIKGCENQWRLFCLDILHDEDWKQRARSVDFQTVYHFLWWYLNQKTTLSGRPKRVVQKSGSLVTFWCCFRLFYERITGEKINNVLPPGTISNALIKLSQKFQLSQEKRENRSMTVDDLKLQIETTLRTTHKEFKLGEIRILLVLFLLLLAPQGSRPQSILNIKFKHVEILLIRDPENPSGPPRLTIRLRLEETKTYRGAKAVKTFLVPEIIYDPSLLLSPHVFLLAILFRHRAFESEGLNDNPHKLSTLKISPRANQLRLGIKEEFQDLPLFRQSVRGIAGYEMSSRPITQNMTNKWIKSIGSLLGFEHSTIAYTLRYFAGNSMDQSVDVSSALRDLILDHSPNSDTFQKHYLNRNVCVDLWAIHRAQNPQHALIRQATSHGGSRDSRRIFTLTDAHIASIKQDRRYVRLTNQIASKKLHRYSAESKELTRQRKNLFRKLKDQKLREVRAEWTQKQALHDIERQIQGEDITQAVDPEPVAPPMTGIQQRMFEALTAPLVNDLEAQFRRRTEAINALVKYCSEEEPIRNSVLETRKPKPPPEYTTVLSRDQQIEEIKRSVFVDVIGADRIRRCFLCVAKACQLGPGHSRFEELCRSFCDDCVLARHFTSVHLDGIAEGDRYECPNCRIHLVHKNHLRLHALKVHGINTDRKRKMRYNGK